jgi:CheY-like chemotaxis protein
MMTARANADDVDRLMQLGAFSVIAKPFDPKTLAETVRGELQSVKAETVRYDFAERLRNDAAILNAFRQALHDDPAGAAMPEGLLTCVHKLAGAAGIFDMPVVSAAASALEEAIVAARESCVIERQLERLLGCIAGGAPPSQPAEPPRRHRPASAMPQSIGA